MNEKADLKISVLQMNSNEDVDRNLNQMKRGVEEAAKAGSSILFFPENSIYFRCSQSESMRYFGLDDGVFGQLQAMAEQFKMHLHLGSAPILENGKRTNSSVIIAPGKEIRSTYSKVHLFDIGLEGHEPTNESADFEHGGELAILKYKEWRLGQSICYDLRFSELYAEYNREQVDAVLIPAAFLVPTGKAHWDVLIRARAIECQAYVIAAAQSGAHESAKGRRETFGHSQIVDPWGAVLAFAESGVQTIHASLDTGKISKIRHQIPMHRHRRVMGLAPLRTLDWE